MIGVENIITNEPSQSSVIALEDSLLMEIKRKEFLDIFKL